MKILIVDDERGLSDVLAELLARWGHAVRAAYTGGDGLLAFQRESADLVLLDMHLPDQDGLDVLESLRSLDPRASVVMVTGFGTDEDAARARQRGAKGCLEKPFSTHALKQLIGSMQAAASPFGPS